MRILFQDRDFLAVDKPAGVWPDARPGGVVRRIAQQIGARGPLDPASELDRDASGIMLITPRATDSDALRRATAHMKAERRYLAVVVGSPPDTTGSVQSHLRLSRRGVVDVLQPGEPVDDAPLAKSQYRVLASGRGLSLVELRDRTAIAGQARAHLAQIGCPILGDKSFRAERDDLGRLALHLAELHFTPPGRPALRLRADCPQEFRAVLAEGFVPTAPIAAETPHEPARQPAAEETGWEHVAGWYDDLIEERRSDHHDAVLYPGVLRLLGLEPGESVIDIACGQGAFCRLLAASTPASRIAGVDSSPSLIDAAVRRSPAGLAYTVADARSLDPAALGAPFDAACCVTALMNIDDLDGAMRSVAALLPPGGRFVAAVLHPAFRQPGRTSWQWDDEGGRSSPRQSRRVDSYLSPAMTHIVMNPGAVAAGAAPVHTQTHHRPIQAYAAACRAAGLLLETIEEWPSHRTSEPGPRAAEENRARAEIPMFLAFRAVKPA